MEKIDFRIFFRKKIGFFLVLLAFSIPINYRLTIYLVAISTFIWVLSLNWYFNYKNILRYKKVAVLIVLWFLYAISLLYSKNINKGVADITQKLSLLILPLVFITSWDDIKICKRNILYSYLLGLILVSSYLLFRAFWNSYDFADNSFNCIPLDTPWENYFLYFRFTHPYHPTYLSLYLCLGLGIVIYSFLENRKTFVRVGLMLVYLLFLTTIYLSSSKAGLIVGASVFIISTFWIIGRKSRIYAGIITLAVAGFIILFILNNNRVAYFINYVQGKVNVEWSADQLAFQNKLKNESTVRFGIWKSVPIAVGNKWLFGVGIGDTKTALVNGYKNCGVDYAATMELNAHNQYLEIILGIGVCGLLVFLTSFYIGFRRAIVNRNMLLFIFLIIILINLMFESIFERVFGIIFFSFFYCLLTLTDLRE